MNIPKTLKYMKKQEWSMGNGQCPACCGVHKGWLGHPCHPTKTSLGHVKGCKMAAIMEELGCAVYYKGELK